MFAKNDIFYSFENLLETCLKQILIWHVFNILVKLYQKNLTVFGRHIGYNKMINLLINCNLSLLLHDNFALTSTTLKRNF